MRFFLIFTFVLCLDCFGYVVPQDGYGSVILEVLAEYNSSFSQEEIGIFEESIRKLSNKNSSFGLNVGKKAPKFSLPGPKGFDISLSSKLKYGPVVLIFFRGNWSPFCNAYLKVVNNEVEKIKGLGASIIGISPQSVAESNSQTLALNLGFPLLSDNKCRVAKSYGLHYSLDSEVNEIYKKSGIDIASINRDPKLGLPITATIVISQNGEIKKIYANPDYKERMETFEITGALEN